MSKMPENHLTSYMNAPYGKKIALEFLELVVRKYDHSNARCFWLKFQRLKNDSYPKKNTFRPVLEICTSRRLKNNLGFSISSIYPAFSLQLV